VTPEASYPVVIEREAELGTLPTLPVGTVVELPQPSGTTWRYYSVGTAAPVVAARLGWAQGNVWLREIERSRMLRIRGRLLFPRLEEAIHQVLQEPQSVHEARGDPSSVYFVATGASLRARGLLMSRSVNFVDAIIEARRVDGGRYLRLFHFSPRDRARGGRRLWP
jgi:hypothetical protein